MKIDPPRKKEFIKEVTFIIQIIPSCLTMGYFFLIIYHNDKNPVVWLVRKYENLEDIKLYSIVKIRSRIENYSWQFNRLVRFLLEFSMEVLKPLGNHGY